MRSSRLKLSPNKTEVMLLGGSQKSGGGGPAPVLGEVHPPLAPSVQSLGVLLDAQLRLDFQVLAVAWGAFHQLHLVRRLRPYVLDSDLVTLIHSTFSGVLTCYSLLPSQITTFSGNEFLFQSDIDFIILDWFHAIKNAIDRLVCICFGSLIKSCFCFSPVFRLNYSTSDTNDRNRVKSRLKKFISRRPSLKTFQEKGLIKDQVFGSHLHVVCEHEGSTVPWFVKVCLEAVEKRGLDVDGIYRVSGNLATIQKLRFVVNQEEKLNLDDSQWEDIHVVTGALKMFFRELPEPLFPYCFFEHFVEAIKNQDDSIRIKSIKALVQKLPRSNYDTMKILFKHLKKIAAKESANLMSTQSLGIVFGPTLLRPEKESGSMAVHMLYQNQLVELMLSEYSKIFEAEED
uniref:Rho GTPase activating protein 15 n=1 Tax=Sphenodon punctatus TaxID=8508 RepID=A0A8D0L684_SPHPU